jgi:hypothetical protein
MRPMKRAARIAVFLFCVAFSIAAIINVFADNTEVQQMAKEVACDAIPVKPLPKTAPPGSRPSECNMAMTHLSRTPFGQSFEYQGNSITRHIGCRRSLILFGSYKCAAE